VGVVIKRSLGQRARVIALRHGIPFVTVETVIKDYLESLAIDAENGERIVIDGITSVTVVRDLNTGELFPRGRVSPALRSRLLKKGVVLEIAEQA
jgi:hypothetical protein